MPENEHIMFEEIPNMFSQMISDDGKPNEQTQTGIHKTYNSLYEELCDKCYPERYMEPYDAKRVSIATRLYGDVLNCENDINKQNELRHRAAEELGITFDGSKLYAYLLNYLNPRLYLHPFSPDKLEFANKYYLAMEANKDDYIELEKIETEVHLFIKEIDLERATERRKTSMNGEQIAVRRFEEVKQWMDGLDEEYWGYMEGEYGGSI